ncbi:hypothetical protein HDU91_005291 [Kappamyces sp. JEL0680]|nr:hypothetical protein HDU91_005291 [Kappamyces sp. JEL0680]
MAQELQREAEAHIKKLFEEIEKVELLLEPFTTMGPENTFGLEDFLANCSPAEKSELLVLMAFAFNTLTFVYVKLQGINPKAHGVKKELARVKEYLTKIESALARQSGPTLRIDQAASKRMVVAGLGAEALKSKPLGQGHKRTDIERNAAPRAKHTRFN